jgi:hypothetical protein
MPFPVGNLIQGRPAPVCVGREDPISRALDLMVENDYSQLPVIDAANRPLGMVTYEGIMQSVRHFQAELDELHVRDAMTAALRSNLEDDLFDLLEQLKRTNAVLIVSPTEELVGIVTSYDSTEFFRTYAEDMMHVEDIEVAVKELVLLPYTREDGSVDEDQLSEAISGVTPGDRGGSPDSRPSFDGLSLYQYIMLLLARSTWPTVGPIFGLPRDRVRVLLEAVTRTRNDLAHFRREISSVDAQRLRYCAKWLGRCREDWDSAKTAALFGKLAQTHDTAALVSAIREEPGAYDTGLPASSTAEDLTKEEIEPASVIAEESRPGESRYAPLADWLQSQPGGTDLVKLTFDEIEKIIGGDLPTSARTHRAWWANDPQAHPQSQLWLDAGWRRSYLNMTEGIVTFQRTRERERAYIDFFSQLLSGLSQRQEFPLREVSPDGASWVVCQALYGPSSGVAIFGYSFARGNQFRAELYIDTRSAETTKRVYDLICAQKSELEAQLGEISWERLNDRRASRVALYHLGAITDDPQSLAELRAWAVDAMVAFYKALEPVASEAIRQVLS